MTKDDKKPSPEETTAERRERSKRARNLAIGLAVGLFMTLIYVVTLVKLGNAAHPPGLGTH